MKYLAIILFFILVNCKGKTDNTVDPSVQIMWTDFINSNPEFTKADLPESYYFHNNKEDANRLVTLITNGKKKAGSAPYFLYKEAAADLPKVKSKSIITDYDGTAQCIIEITKVDTIPFNQITKEYAALDMGTTLQPLNKWKQAHWAFFSNAMEQSGKTPTEDMLVVCEKFKVIWPKK